MKQSTAQATTAARLALWLLLGAVVLWPGSAGAQTPLSLTGYNADVVTEANTATRFAVSFDIERRAFFEAGAKDDSGVAHNDGLPAGAGPFASAFVNTVTGNHTQFLLQPYDQNNALRLVRTAIGVLTLTTPAAFTSLAFLAGSGDAGPTTSASVVLNFTDGDSAPLTVDAFDWGRTPFTTAAIANMGRNTELGATGTAFTYERFNGFGLFETDVDLVSLGLSGRTLQSVTVTGVSDAFQISVLAISGVQNGAVTAPEPGSLLLVCLPLLAGMALALWKPKVPTIRTKIIGLPERE